MRSYRKGLAKLAARIFGLSAAKRVLNYSNSFLTENYIDPLNDDSLRSLLRIIYSTQNSKHVILNDSFKGVSEESFNDQLEDLFIENYKEPNE